VTAFFSAISTWVLEKLTRAGWEGVSSGALVIVTAVYVIFTHQILKANQRMVEVAREQLLALTRPYITVAPDWAPDSLVLVLRIKNTGHTSAGNLRLSMDRSFFRFAIEKPDEDLSRYSAFREPIASFAPGAELQFLLAQAWFLSGKNADPAVTPLVFTVRAQYSFPGGVADESTTVDLRPYFDSLMSDSPWKTATDNLVKAIEKIAASVRGPSC